MENSSTVEKDFVLEELVKREKRLQAIQKLVADVKPPLEKESIRIVKKSKYLEYYLITEKNDTNGKFLPKNQKSKAEKIIQHDYELKVQKEVKKELSFVSQTIKNYKKDKIEEIYENLSVERRKLVEPIIPTKKQIVQNWMNQKFTENPYEERPIFKTESGSFVRSKSEVMIANELYCSKMVRKMAIYLKNNYIFGKNLIITFENSENPLTPQTVEKMINEYLK